MPLPSTTPARLFLVDDHAMVREGLATVLTQAGFAICGQAGNIRETFAHPELATADLAVVDLSIGEDSGLKLIQALRARRLPSLVYSMHEDANIVRHAFAAGALGYVTKREVAQSLLEALQTVLTGERYLSPRVAAALQKSAPLDGLNGQQRQLYRLLGQGCTNEQVAQRLGISLRTFESYCVRIVDKLGVSGVKELRQQAIRAARAVAPEDVANL